MATRQKKPPASTRKQAVKQRSSRTSRADSGNERSLRDHVVKLLESDGAHVSFDAAVQDLPPEMRGAKAAGVPFTAWQLLEHLRIAQRDILEFSRNPRHQSPKWPEGYWPDAEAPPGEKAWDESVSAFRG